MMRNSVFLIELQGGGSISCGRCRVYLSLLEPAIDDSFLLIFLLGSVIENSFCN